MYISDLNDAAPLFHSQVIPHTKELNRYFDVTVIILSRNTKTVINNKKVIDYNSIRGDYTYPFAKVIFLTQKREIEAVVKSAKFDLIYARGIRGGILGCLIKKYLYSNQIPLLNDFRGDIMDGMKVNFFNKAILNYSTGKIIDNVDILFLVSNFLKDKICKDYGFAINKAYVFPTFVPDDKLDFNQENRKYIRKELGFTNKDIVILYSGSLVKFQNVETILSAFKQSSNPHLKMLILTKDKKISSLLKKYDLSIDKVKIKSVKYEEIEKYYHAADFGILIRDNTNTNKSAAPTKFAEYVNSGLSLIINSIDADYVEIFKEKKLEGFLLDKKEDLLDCFNDMTFSHIKRNVLKINTLSEIVRMQKEVFDSYI
jgi:glycosyltransferase involved in cell wall biosynthesis